MKRLFLLLILAVPAAAQAQAGAAAASAEAVDPEVALKARWQRLLREADERIADAQHKLEAARIALDTASRQAVVITTGPTMAARAAAIEAVKQCEADLLAAKKAKDDLLEQARQENVPPGWLR